MERPILFNSEMVRAILDGRKTQTRRVIKPQPIISANGWARWGYKYGAPKTTSPKTCIWHEPTWKIEQKTSPIDEYCPYGVPDDTLWVRESWAVHTLSHEKPSQLFHPQKVWYRSDENLHTERGKWRPSIFMPRWASRMALQIKNVRVERVQDITEEDAKAEGVAPVPFASGFDDSELHKAAFFQLWDSINAKRGYPVKSNPFVWVVEFERARP